MEVVFALRVENAVVYMFRFYLGPLSEIDLCFFMRCSFPPIGNEPVGQRPPASLPDTIFGHR